MPALSLRRRPRTPLGRRLAAHALALLGLIVHGGRQRYRLATGAFTVAGVLSDDGKTIRLERSRALRTPIASMKEALQAGPFLIENGKPVAGLNNSRRARRSFIATDGRGRWCIAV